MAKRPSQSPREEKSIEFHSLRKGLIARTPRVTCCAGAAGVGRVFGMGEVYRGEFLGFLRAFFPNTSPMSTSYDPQGEAIER